MLKAARSAAIESGEGWSIREVNLPRGERQVIMFNRATLRQQLSNARESMAGNDGKLPDNGFWNAVVRVRDQDVGLFARTHGCLELRRLLRGRRLELAPTPVPVTPPNEVPLGTPSTVTSILPNMPPGVVPTKLVPEPASVLLMAAGVVLGALFFRHTGKRRRAATL